MSASIPGTDTMELGGRAFTVRELTLAEIRAHFAKADRPVGDAVDGLLIEGWNLQDVSLFGDATASDLDGLRPTEIRELLGAIEQLNVDFFATCERVRALAAALPTPGPTSSGPLPD